MTNKIFVSIASYCDSELIPTIDNALKNAENPKSIIFGICLQDYPEILDNFKYKNHPQFKIIPVDYKKSGGCCWARSRIQSLYSGEEYYMQIDSHHRFVKNWDTLAIEFLNKCKSKKPIISAYPPAYEPETRGYLDNQIPNKNICREFSDKGKVVFVPYPITNYKILSEPQSTFTMAAGFIFTFGKWINEVPYDPVIYFDGEEDTLSIRSWTRGWDMFYPHRVITYHYYNRPKHTKHWDVDNEWWKKEKESIERVKDVLSGKSMGTYGVGKVRSLNDYQVFSGINFSKRRLSNNAKNGIPTIKTRKQIEKPIEKPIETPSEPLKKKFKIVYKTVPVKKVTYKMVPKKSLQATPSVIEPKKPRKIQKSFIKPIQQTIKPKKGGKKSKQDKIKILEEKRNEITKKLMSMKTCVKSKSKKKKSDVMPAKYIKKNPKMVNPPKVVSKNLKKIKQTPKPIQKKIVKPNKEMIIPSSNNILMNVIKKPKTRQRGWSNGETTFKKELNVWGEYKNGERFATFQEIRDTKSETILYDVKRKMFVRLDAARYMYKEKGAWKEISLGNYI